MQLNGHPVGELTSHLFDDFAATDRLAFRKCAEHRDIARLKLGDRPEHRRRAAGDVNLDYRINRIIAGTDDPVVIIRACSAA